LTIFIRSKWKRQATTLCKIRAQEAPRWRGVARPCGSLSTMIARG
jgi:hypothetical protein